MTSAVSDQRAHARVRLVSGQSGGQVWEVDAGAAGARVDVGSANTCAWQVVAPNVSPKHLEMYWDGEVLWIARAEGAAEVRVDGIIVDDWYATMQGSTIQMGGAALRVELGASLDTSGLASRTDDHVLPPSQKTTLATPSTKMPDRESIPDAPTMVAGGSAAEPSPFHGAATQILPPKGAPGLRDDDPRAAAARIAAFEQNAILQQQTQLVTSPSGPGGHAPVFGGAAAGGGHPQSAPSSLPTGQATQLVSLPEARGAANAAAALGRPPPPRIGGSGQNVARATPSPPSPVLGGGAAGGASAAPTDPAVGLPSIIVSPDGPAGASALGAAVDAGGPKFAPPPPDDGSAKGEKKQMALPPRTWALLAVTVVAASGLILMDSGDGETDVATPAPPVAPETDATTEGPDTNPPQVDEGPVELTEEEALALPRQAADALAANRQSEAYRLYRRLSRAYPDDETYGNIARILRRRIQAQCRDGVDPAGRPCEVPE